MILSFIKFIIITFFLLVTKNSYSNEEIIVIASTSSTYDTGLLNYINKEFYKKYNIRTKVLSQGTGQALRTAKDGNAEILLVHHKESELDFMKKGYGIERYEIMYNDYVLVGPISDNKKCLSLEKKLLNINPDQLLSSYLSVGQGMGNTLLIANEKKAYTLTDRSTWISFNRRENLHIVCENFPPMFNQYGLILVNPILNKNFNLKSANIYINWFLTDEVKKLVNSFKIKEQQLFFYNYK